MRERLLHALAAAIWLVIAPGTVAGYVPWRITGWEPAAPAIGLPGLRAAGVVLIAAGVAILVECFVRFVVRGRGTPAPVLAPRRLVVSGLYRHMRNPMYAGVLAAIAGQALLFRSRALALYGLLIWALFHTFVLLVEEPRLRRLFGEEYATYRRGVRRWLPRARAWRSETATTTKSD